MVRRFSLLVLALCSIVAVPVEARADVPMPECVGNPACQNQGGCSMSLAPSGAAGAALALGLVALAARARRRRP